MNAPLFIGLNYCSRQSSYRFPLPFCAYVPPFIKYFPSFAVFLFMIYISPHTVFYEDEKRLLAPFDSYKSRLRLKMCSSGCPGNCCPFLLLPPSGMVKFIDYEYADYNYQAFDIGNHFNEFAGRSAP